MSSRIIFLAIVGIIIYQPAVAENTPCSQSKGGINHCDGSYFICNDEDFSHSKKDCREYTGQNTNSEKSKKRNK